MKVRRIFAFGIGALLLFGFGMKTGRNRAERKCEQDMSNQAADNVAVNLITRIEAAGRPLDYDFLFSGGDKNRVYWFDQYIGSNFAIIREDMENPYEPILVIFPPPGYKHGDKVIAPVKEGNEPPEEPRAPISPNAVE